MSRLHQQRKVSTQFDDVKMKFIKLTVTNSEILGRTCEGKCFLNLVDPWFGQNLKVLQKAQQAVFDKRKQFQNKWSCFLAHNHIFTPYRMPF